MSEYLTAPKFSQANVCRISGYGAFGAAIVALEIHHNTLAHSALSAAIDSTEGRNVGADLVDAAMANANSVSPAGTRKLTCSEGYELLALAKFFWGR